MTTQADITLALFHVTQDATTLDNDIGALVNAIADQNTISASKKLDPSILAAINTARVQIAAFVTAISGVTGSSAV